MGRAERDRDCRSVRRRHGHLEPGDRRLGAERPRLDRTSRRPSATNNAVVRANSFPNPGGWPGSTVNVFLTPGGSSVGSSPYVGNVDASFACTLPTHHLGAPAGCVLPLHPVGRECPELGVHDGELVEFSAAHKVEHSLDLRRGPASAGPLFVVGERPMPERGRLTATSGGQLPPAYELVDCRRSIPRPEPIVARGGWHEKEPESFSGPRPVLPTRRLSRWDGSRPARRCRCCCCGPLRRWPPTTGPTSATPSG